MACLSDRHLPPKVAIIREEGSNGDREMAAALHMVGFEVWDVNVQDLLDEKIDLGPFRGLVFVGGFSYADVFGSAKGTLRLTHLFDFNMQKASDDVSFVGWAAVLAFSPSARKQLENFYKREDTFSRSVQWLPVVDQAGAGRSHQPPVRQGQPH